MQILNILQPHLQNRIRFRLWQNHKHCVETPQQVGVLVVFERLHTEMDEHRRLEELDQHRKINQNFLGDISKRYYPKDSVRELVCHGYKRE